MVKCERSKMGSHSVGMLGTSPSWTPVTQHPKDYLNSSLSILAFILWQVASQLFFSRVWSIHFLNLQAVLNTLHIFFLSLVVSTSVAALLLGWSSQFSINSLGPEAIRWMALWWASAVAKVDAAEFMVPSYWPWGACWSPCGGDASFCRLFRLGLR